MKKRIIITEKNHPHYGEIAELQTSEEGTIQIYNIFGKRKLKVKLISCTHGINECFVNEDGVSLSPT